MRMIPPIIPPDTPSAGERHVFELFAADEAHPGWTVLHSQDIAEHRSQMEGEMDFLVVAPGLGVLVLEVKGCGELHRSGGMWYYGKDPEGDPRGPFKQCSEAMHSLRDRIAAHRRHQGGVLWQSAACFPFYSFRDASEEWHPWQVVDQGKLEQRPVGECVVAVLEQARERAAALGKSWFDAAAAAEPTHEQCDEIVRVLRPDFEFFESPKDRARRADAEIRHYTEEQFVALDQLRRNERVILSGPAGTGKTLLAIEQARRSAAAGRRVLLLCFNRPLGTWLAEQVAGGAEAPGTAAGAPGGAAAPGAGSVTALTLHEHMARVAGVHPGGEQVHDQAFWYDQLPTLALEALMDAGGSADPGAAAATSPYDELILDEGQDMLRESYLDVLDMSLAGGLEHGRFRIFGDFDHQAIYDAASLTMDDLLARCPGTAVLELLVNCRNTPRVARLVAAVQGSDDWGKVLRPDDEVDPAVRYYRDADQQCDLLVEALQELHDDGFTGPQVAVLSTHGDHHAAAADFCEVAGPPWNERLTPLVPAGEFEPDLHSGHTKYASIHRFKGLESRAVILTDIDDLAAPQSRALFCVGATRATHRLVVLAHEPLRGRLG
jgi:hypothetical protein